MTAEPKPDSELLTLDQAAAEVGWTGKYKSERMQRLLTGKELTAGRQIMSRVGKRGDRKISRGALQRHCPELFETSGDKLAREFRRAIENFDAKLSRKIEEHPKIQRLELDVRRVGEGLNEVARRLNRLL